MSENASNIQTEQMKYVPGDEVTIMRGLDRNKVAKVTGVDATNRKYNVTFTDGSFAVVNEVNVKPPQEGQVTAAKLADLVKGATDLPSLIESLAKSVDGFSKAYDSE